MSRQSISVLCLTATATATVAAEHFVSAAGAIASAGGNALGVARTAAAVGEEFPVDVLGTAVVMASGAVTAGAALEVGAGGTAAVQSEGTQVARALEAAADGEAFEALLIAN